MCMHHLACPSYKDVIRKRIWDIPLDRGIKHNRPLRSKGSEMEPVTIATNRTLETTVLKSREAWSSNLILAPNYSAKKL